MTDATSYYEAVEMQKRIRCFMDGIDWQHHLDADALGTTLYPSEASVRRQKKCIADGGGCGIVEVEVRLVRWVEKQDLTADGVILTDFDGTDEATSQPPQEKSPSHPVPD